MFGKHGEKEDKPYNIFLLVTECKQLLEIEFLSSLVLPPGLLWTWEFRVRLVTRSILAQLISDITCMLMIPKLQVWVSVCVLDVFI